MSRRRRARDWRSGEPLARCPLCQARLADDGPRHQCAPGPAAAGSVAPGGQLASTGESNMRQQDGGER